MNKEHVLIQQMRVHLGVLNALIEQIRWRNERIAKAIAELDRDVSTPEVNNAI